MATILIVDDSGLSRRTLRRILESGGHAVVEAADGMAAIEQYYLTKPEVVFLDLIMVGMDGMEVLAELRRLNPKALVIIASADIQSSTRTMVKELGAVGFVTKPFEPKDVMDALEAVLEK